MKRLIILLFVFSKAYAQEPTYVPMKSNYLFRGIKMDTLFIPPVYADTATATTKVNFAGSVVRVGSKLYMRNSALTQWVDLSSQGSTFDSTSLSNRINNKVDSVTKVSDSVKYWKNGTAYFAFKDSSGGVGNLTLNQVTDYGNTTQNNIIFVDDADLEMDTFSSILFANNSRLQEGTIDAGYGGNKGVAQICGLGYELKWEGGRLFAMGSSGNTIREARYMFGDIPTSTDDYTKGYYVGTRWVLDNGDTYVCTDNSLNAAVWVLQPNAFDSTSLSNRINQKVDSVKRSGDSVYYYKNGTGYFAFRDSVGAGQNGRWGNDTATIILAKVHNSTATTLTRGTVVMLNGANGDVASVIRANNKYDSTSARTIGLVKDPIAAGDTGWVVTQGQASKLQLGAYTEGDVLYLDSLDGGLTKTKPHAPYHQVFVCIVERANNGNGLAYVKPQNGQELGELHDVQITNPINNQVLVYSDTQDIWKNRNVYSVVDTTKLSARIDLRVRYSDTASMLSPYLRKSDSTLYQTKYGTDTMRTNLYSALNGKQNTLIFSTGLTNNAGTITNNLSVGVSGGQSVIGGSAASNNLTLSSTSNATKGKILFGTSAYDEANNRLGLATASPATTLDVVGKTNIAYSPTSNSDNVLVLNNTSSNVSNTGVLSLQNDAFGAADIRINGTTTTGLRMYANNTPLTSSPSGAGFQFFSISNPSFPGQVYFDGGAHNSSSLIFRTAITAGTITQRMRIFANGNVSVSSSATDPGFLFNVAGTGRFTSTLTTAGQILGLTARTSNHNVTATDHIIPCDATSGAFNVTLPTASGRSGQTYTIKKTDSGANAVTVNTTSSQTIDGSTTYSLATQWKYVTVVSNGSNWLIISNN